MGQLTPFHEHASMALILPFSNEMKVPRRPARVWSWEENNRYVGVQKLAKDKWVLGCHNSMCNHVLYIIRCQ